MEKLTETKDSAPAGALLGFGVAIEEALAENRPARRRRPGQRRQYPC